MLKNMMLSMEMLDKATIVCLILISLVISLIAFFSCRKNQNSSTQVIVIPLLSAASLLFGSSDGFLIRIVSLTLLLIAYASFLGIFYIISYCINKIKLKKASHHISSRLTELKMVLPIDNECIVDDRFIDDLPANVESLSRLIESMIHLKDSFISKFSTCENDNERSVRLKSFFLGVCYHLANLFDDSTRVHVRILTSDGYKKFVATCEGGNGHEYNKSMRTMSLDNKMISTSYTRKCSLIKTLNPTLHEDGNNRKWKNYLMFSIPQITYDGKPVFSIGISVTRKKNDLFLFLNYCEIETIICRFIEEIVDNEECHLKDFITKFYFPSSSS